MPDMKELIEDALSLREQYQALDKESKAIREVFNAKKFEIIKACNEMGVDSTAVKGVATVSVTTKKRPTVTDWDAVANYVKQNDALYLFQKRIAAGAYEELVEMEGEIPGIETYEEPDLSLRRN
jgi:NACalpha-BTF3-like transcription factor